MKPTLPVLVALLLTPRAGLRAEDEGKAPVRTGQRLVDLPLRHQVWPSEPPKDCPFEQSKTLAGIVFTGAHSDYRTGDTFYPSWATDGNQYSPFTDAVTDGVQSFSFGQQATTGDAVMMGDDPLNLTIKNTAPPQVANPLPYAGRYPAGSLVYNGVWHYGTYCLGPDGFVSLQGFTYNWPVLGPMPGFRISKDYGKTWTASPLSPKSPLFPEPAKHLGAVKISAPHFADFGKNMEHSPDGKAYLLGMGAEENDPKPRYANLSWISADQVYLARVTPSPETINDLKAYEFFAGHDAAGKPVWTNDFAKIKAAARFDLYPWMGVVSNGIIEGVHASAKYLDVQSAELNGKPLNRPWLGHSEIKDGAQLRFLMGSAPSS